MCPKRESSTSQNCHLAYAAAMTVRDSKSIAAQPIIPDRQVVSTPSGIATKANLEKSRDAELRGFDARRTHHASRAAERNHVGET
jgi:hypothetical protein